MTPSLSVVIPVFNGSQTIGEVVSRVINVCASRKYEFEIILVNDGSRDNSWEVIRHLAEQEHSVTSINLAKNYGQHTANLCGFRASRNNYIITLDDDLQNPPEEIPNLVDKATAGYDLVLGMFAAKKHNSARKAGSKIIQCLNKIIFNVDEDLILSNYRCIHRSVIKPIISTRHYRPYIPGLLLEHSCNRVNVCVKHGPRKHGSSNYTLVKIIKLTSDLLFNHSTIPLRFVAAIGFTATTACIGLCCILTAQSVIYGAKTPGWTSIMVLTSFNSSLILLMLSVIGEYTIRILKATANIDEYIMREVTQ